MNNQQITNLKIVLIIWLVCIYLGVFFYGIATSNSIIVITFGLGICMFVSMLAIIYGES